MIELKITCENETIKDAFVNFILNYKTNVSDYMNQLVGNDGSPCDSDVVLGEDNTITVYHIAPDKGFVLGEMPAESETPVQIMKYSDLAIDKRYLLPEKDRLVLYYKQEAGTVDIKLGAFKTLADAIKGFNSEAVKTTIERAEDMKKARLKDLKRLKKLGKAPAEDAQVVENQNA